MNKKGLEEKGFSPSLWTTIAPCLGFELLYQPEVVRLYLSLLTESRNFNTLEAAAGALQNLSAGNWTVRSQVGREGKTWTEEFQTLHWFCLVPLPPSGPVGEERISPSSGSGASEHCALASGWCGAVGVGAV